MFIACYPAMFVPEDHGEGFHVRFPDLPEALTGGDDLTDTFEQAADCLAEAIAGRIARDDEIPRPSKPKRGQHLISVPLYLAPKLALYLAKRERRMTQYRTGKAPWRQRSCGPAHVKPQARHET
jgi:antitoxin HicB